MKKSLVLIALFLTSLSPSVFAAPPSKVSTFRMRLPFEMHTLDWNQGEIPIPIIHSLMRGLFRVDAEGKVVPDLVRSVQTSDGSTIWNLRVKEGIRWSDGEELLAQHVADGLKRLLDRNLASTYAYILFDVVGAQDFYAGKTKDVAGIKVLGRHRLEIRLTEPRVFLPAILTHWSTFPARSDLIAKNPHYWRTPSAIATLGLFQVEKWEPSSEIVLKKNTQAQPPARFERVEAKVILDDQTALNLFDTGNIDLMTDPGMAGQKRRDVTHLASPILYFVGYGPGHPLTAQPAALRALGAALTRTEIPIALGARHIPSQFFVPQAFLTAPSNAPSLEEGDPAELLSQAGFADRSAIPPIVLHFYQRPSMPELAQWIQSQWKTKLGLKVTLQPHDIKSYWGDLGAKPVPFFLNSKGPTFPDADAYLRLFSTDSQGRPNSQNLGRWTDPDFDRWLTQSARTENPQRRIELLRLANRRLTWEKPGASPLYFRDTQYLIHPRVKGLVINPLTSIDLSTVELR